MPSEPLIVNLLSGPRNVSTALMYSFAQRTDTAVVDEPLYGRYLAETLAPQPHRDELLEVLETNGDKIIRETLLSPPADKTVYFVKNMAHHLVESDDSWLNDDRVRNVFLVRDPIQMLPSLINQIETPNLRDAAYEAQAMWFGKLENPLVLDAKPLLQNPEAVLSELCEELEIPFDPAMLNWEPGPRPEDGAWAPYWYHNLHQSTGFAPYQEKSEPFPEPLKPLVQQCFPHYLTLLNHAIGA